ncbi:Hydrolase tropI [Fusarium oxysporum f. sp. cubense]|uniref:Hydrolase tropI n=1 Tax=Fusarium oxysporum f. sp. cubense TaxID=61366 RepID=A0A559LS69_FUSOC|nr:Hydrolase tropI [Fusarium oxysporum f. sp. cubense]
MASHPPAACCTIANLHEGTPKGDIVKVGNVTGYLAKSSKESKQAVLYLPDIFGIWQNSKLMADAFAAEGYTCLVVDTFNGDPVPLEMPEGFDIMKWLGEGSDGKNPHTAEAVDPIVVSGIEYLKSIGITQIAAVGYCLGAKHLIRHYKDGINVGFIAHPSFVELEELSAITGPLSIAAAELDDLFTVEKRHESEGILSKSKQDFQINLFSGVHHGFAVKGDMKDKRQLFAKEQAFNQAVSWFKRHLE